MVTLREAVETAELNLRVMVQGGVTALKPLGLFYQAMQFVRDGDLSSAISKAQASCEALIDCAHDADDNGRAEDAKALRGIVSDLSPVIAGYMSRMSSMSSGA